MCERKFRDDPQRFIEKLDKAAADAQRQDSPLDTCPVSGEKVEGTGDPAEVGAAILNIRGIVDPGPETPIPLKKRRECVTIQ